MEGFTPDPRVEEVAKAYATDAIDIAEGNFGVRLDWTIESIKDVEHMLGQLHDAMQDDSPSPDTLDVFAKAFGSYLGEVIRRRHGGSWGMLALGDAEYPGTSHGIWPWARVHKRIVNGPEDNVWHYYQLIFARR